MIEIFGSLALTILILVMILGIAILITPWVAILYDLYSGWVEEVEYKIFEKRKKEKSKGEE